MVPPPPTLTSDAVTTNPLQITTELQHHYADRPPRYNFQKADWARFNRSLVLPKQRLSPTQACGSLTDANKSAAATSIPLLSPPKHKPSYRWTPECTEARRAQHLALTRYNNHKGNMTLWVNLKRAQAKFKYEIQLAKKQTWTKFISTLNSSSTTGEVWHHIYIRSKRISRHIRAVHTVNLSSITNSNFRQTHLKYPSKRSIFCSTSVFVWLTNSVFLTSRDFDFARKLLTKVWQT